MEGVGARLGRSSARYGSATVFTGPVRKWKKKWVHVPPSSSNHHQRTAANGAVNGSAAHLCFYKWTPITPSQNKDANNNNDKSDNGNVDSKESNEEKDVAAEEPPRRKFKYIPIAVLEEQNESSEQIEDEAKPNELDENALDLEATSKRDGSHEKPDINDVPMDESEAPENKPLEQHDLNESPLELSMDFKAENISEVKEDQVKDEQLE